ncbi:hypothetical protein O181_012069 [Austropuccinia psidii MF-1]|uniref:CCHC-type domain-containing protein n=1 Tax=Austropuccinia psidii MF-1 TaxID=1389203 RepID=A0A9Q3BVP1_9BASI|nr:hypothetical protein [Austropuccinia psidii MF-1]
MSFKYKPKERFEEVTKKKNPCHNCGSTDHYANNCPKAKKKVYVIEQVPEEEYLTEDSESDSMGDSIREQSNEDQDPREEFLVEYQEETQLEIQDIQLEAGLPHGAHSSIVAKVYPDNHFPNCEKQLLPTRAKNFTSSSGKMKLIGTIIKVIIIPHRKEQAYYHWYQKGKEISLDIYPISTHEPLEELLNEFRQGQFSTTLTSKQKLSLLKILRNNRPPFAIGEEPLGKIRGHDEELYLDVERPYPPMLRRPPYPESLETRKEIEKHINEFLEIDFIRKIGHNEIVEITTPVLITWHNVKSRLCGYFRALNNYTKADRYPMQRIPHALEKLTKSKYITKIYFMKGLNQNGVKPNSMKLLIIIYNMGIYEYTRMPFGITNLPAHFQRMMDTIF